MGKKSKNTDIVIHCDSPEVAVVLRRFFAAYASELKGQIKQALGQQGIQSDPTFRVNDDGTIKASKRSYDKGLVITTPGGATLHVEPYKGLPKGAIYSIPDQAQFAVYEKTNEGIDSILGHFRTWEDLTDQLATVKKGDPETKGEPDITTGEPVMHVETNETEVEPSEAETTDTE